MVTFWFSVAQHGKSFFRCSPETSTNGSSHAVVVPIRLQTFIKKLFSLLEPKSEMEKAFRNSKATWTCSRLSGEDNASSSPLFGYKADKLMSKCQIFIFPSKAKLRWGFFVLWMAFNARLIGCTPMLANAVLQLFRILYDSGMRL